MTEDWKNSCGFSKRLQWITTLTTAYHNLSPSSSLADAQPHATRLENEAYYKATSEAEYNRLCQEVIDELEAQSLHKPPTLHPEAPFGISAESARDGQVAPIKLGAYDACIFHADGLMSTIYRSTHLSDGTLVALKLTTPHMMSPPHNSKREARILRRIASHRNIIILLDAFDLPGGRLVLVFPFMRYNLAEVLARSILTTNQTRTILRDMFCGLKHIHKIGIIHRDVKPSNIVLDSLDGPACITDFGISWAPSDPQSEPANEKIIDVGSTSYRPPEILFGSTNYNTSLDLWAAGCVVAETLDIQHRQLFDAGDLGSELTLIKSIFTTLGTPNAQTWPESARLPDWGKFQFHEYDAKPWENILPGVSSHGRDLVSKLICYESSSRLTAELALHHPFLSQEH